MPVIRIDFDADHVSQQEIATLSEHIQNIVSEITNIEDVMVYANSSQVRIKVHPIEIFVHMSAHKITDADALLSTIKNRIATWKSETGFSQKINLTLIPEPWKIEIGI